MFQLTELLQVRAFNYYGAGPFSKIRYGRTSGTRTDTERQEKRKKKVSRKSDPKQIKRKEDDHNDSDAKIYLILGVSLGCVCVVLFSVCMVVTLWRRHKTAEKFSSTNANIHKKYQDTSLQINSRLQYGETEYQDKADTSQESHQAVHETSFTVTDQSYEANIDQYSQGSTVFVQVTDLH